MDLREKARCEIFKLYKEWFQSISSMVTYLSVKKMNHEILHIEILWGIENLLGEHHPSFLHCMLHLESNLQK